MESVARWCSGLARVCLKVYPAEDKPLYSVIFLISFFLAGFIIRSVIFGHLWCPQRASPNPVFLRTSNEIPIPYNVRAVRFQYFGHLMFFGPKAPWTLPWALVCFFQVLINYSNGTVLL